MIQIGSEGQRLPGLGLNIPGKSLAVEHEPRVEFILTAECACFREHVACGRVVHLNFRKRAVFAQDRQSVEQKLKIRPRFPIRKIAANKVGAEQIRPIPARPVTLRSSGKIQLRLCQKFMFNFESGAKRILAVFRHQQTEKVWTHACVEILADLQSDFNLLGKRR